MGRKREGLRKREPEGNELKDKISSVILVSLKYFLYLEEIQNASFPGSV